MIHFEVSAYEWLATLQQRLQETPRRMIVVAGPRQIGKSTLVSQALDGRFASFIATDQPQLRDGARTGLNLRLNLRPHLPQTCVPLVHG